MARTCAVARARRAVGRETGSVLGPVAVQRRQEGRHALARRGRRDEDLGAFGLGSVGRGPARRGNQHRAELGRGPLCARLVALVDDHEVGDLEQAGLDGLDLVPHLGRLEHDGRVRRGRDLDLALARPDRLDEHEVEAGGVEHGRGRRRRRRQPAGVAARRHRADEHVAIAGIRLHPHPVAEQGATGDRRRRIHGHDRDRTSGRADLGEERGDQGRLARPGRPGDAHEMGATRRRIQPAQGGLGDRSVVLDRGQQAGEGQPVPGDGGVGESGRARRRVAIGRLGRVAAIGRGRVRSHASRAVGRWSAGTRRPTRWSSRARTPPTPRRP